MKKLKHVPDWAPPGASTVIVTQPFPNIPLKIGIALFPNLKALQQERGLGRVFGYWRPTCFCSLPSQPVIGYIALACTDGDLTDETFGHAMHESVHAGIAYRNAFRKVRRERPGSVNYPKHLLKHYSKADLPEEMLASSIEAIAIATVTALVSYQITHTPSKRGAE